MSEYTHRTDTICAVKTVIVRGKQIRHWLEFQLLDEQGDPLPHQPYRASNEATRCGLVPEFSGQSDAQGVIRLEGLHPIAVTLWLTADPLAEVMQTRRLRATRGEKLREPVYTYSYGPPAPGSRAEKLAREGGYAHHYLRIGQLCDRLPKIEPEWTGNQLPAFHFPDPTFSGFTVAAEALNRRHVLEICPFRAWNLILHHQPDYSMANAYNLGLMADLSYSDVTFKARKQRVLTPAEELRGSVEEFFIRQCQDLSRTPAFPPPTPGGLWIAALVVDVPFSERYTTAVMLDGPRLPQQRVLTRRLAKITKLYLVPSLSDEKSQYANEQQKAFIQSLSRDSLKKYFPPYSNPETGSHGVSAKDHFMSSQYLPFLHNQLLELSAPDLPLERKQERAAFIEQMTKGSAHSPEEERKRNELFLALQALLPMTLGMTQQLEGGNDAITRFAGLERESGEPTENIYRKRPTEE